MRFLLTAGVPTLRGADFSAAAEAAEVAVLSEDAQPVADDGVEAVPPAVASAAAVVRVTGLPVVRCAAGAAAPMRAA